MYREALATARAERENNEAKLRREVLVLQQNVKDAQVCYKKKFIRCTLSN